ncbi:MAG TPA: hypothetical protein VK504_09460 [Vicinamibacterales bacterium]|nr:hypothetical protein [Vicinamibacterales bacterium]
MDAEVDLQEMLSAAFVTVDALMRMGLDASPDPAARMHNIQVLESRIMGLFANLSGGSTGTKH